MITHVTQYTWKHVLHCVIVKIHLPCISQNWWCFNGNEHTLRPLDCSMSVFGIWCQCGNTIWCPDQSKHQCHCQFCYDCSIFSSLYSVIFIFCYSITYTYLYSITYTYFSTWHPFICGHAKYPFFAPIYWYNYKAYMQLCIPW